MGNVLHRNGVPFTTYEKAAVLSISLKSFGKEESKKSIQTGLIKRIFQQSKKENIPKLLYFFLNSKGSDTFWPAEKLPPFIIIVFIFISFSAFLSQNIQSWLFLIKLLIIFTYMKTYLFLLIIFNSILLAFFFNVMLHIEGLLAYDHR